MVNSWNCQSPEIFHLDRSISRINPYTINKKSAEL